MSRRFGDVMSSTLSVCASAAPTLDREPGLEVSAENELYKIAGADSDKLMLFSCCFTLYESGEEQLHLLTFGQKSEEVKREADVLDAGARLSAVQVSSSLGWQRLRHRTPTEQGSMSAKWDEEEGVPEKGRGRHMAVLAHQIQVLKGHHRRDALKISGEDLKIKKRRKKMPDVQCIINL